MVCIRWRSGIVFDFDKWLAGDDVATERITGEVDTGLPFPHMDENAR